MHTVKFAIGDQLVEVSSEGPRSAIGHAIDVLSGETAVDPLQIDVLVIDLRDVDGDHLLNFDRVTASISS